MPSVFSILKVASLVVLLTCAIYFFRFTEVGRTITPNAVLESIRSYEPYDRVVYVLVYIVGTVALVPGTILSFAGAVLFGTLEGTLYTWIGATTGSVLAYGVAKLLGRDFVDQLLAGRLAAFHQKISEHGFTGLLIIRLLPIFPFNGVNFASGVLSIRFRDYVLATAIGILPGTFVYQYLFANFGQRILNEGIKIEYFRDPKLLSALALFLLFIIGSKWLSGKVGIAMNPAVGDAAREEPTDVTRPER